MPALLRPLSPLPLAFFNLRRRIAVLLIVMALAVALAGAASRRIGDNLQVALPVVALGCEVLNGRALDYLGRYVVLFAGIHASKAGLGDLPLNLRPNGHDYGFPSGHTATAAFGAHGIVRACVAGSPVAQAAAVLAAGFTGASRIEAGQHTIWQVLAGAVWGMAVDAGLRSGVGRRRMRHRLRHRLGRALLAFILPVVRGAAAWRRNRKGARCPVTPSPVFP